MSGTFSSSINYNASIPGKPVGIHGHGAANQNSSTGRVDLVVPSLGINVSRFELPLSRILNPDAVTSKWYTGWCHVCAEVRAAHQRNRRHPV